MSRVTKSDLGSAANPAPLDTAVAGRFSRSIRLTLATGGVADSAEVAPGTVLETRFQNRDADALAPGAVEEADLSTSGGQLVLSLPVARRVRRVRLAAPVDGDRIAAFRFDGSAVSEDAVKSASHGGSGALLNVTDSALILKRRNGGDSALTPGAIEAVTLRYAPLNPRLALRLAGETGPGIPFPVQTDAEGTPVFPADGSHGADLAAAMRALLASLPPPLPDPLEIDLVLSADEPCQARIDALDLTLVLQSRAFPEKEVLRFPGGRRVTQSLEITLPIGAVISGGALGVTVSGTPPAAAKGGAPSAALPPSSGDGLRVSGERRVATRLQQDAALVIVGAAVLLAAPDGPTELRATLHADANGLPGPSLAESAPAGLARAGPTEVAFTFSPTALPAGPVWLGLVALSGTAIALLGGTGSFAHTEEPGFVLIEDDLSRGLVASLVPIAAAVAATPSGGPVIALGETVLQGTPAQGAVSLDLAAALSAGPAPAALHVSSSARSVVTLDPPLLRYELP
ncbi:hypothetical protein R5H30_12330 [Sulfitobacter sp. D35]|uniref:hypothetical protein n=1 Tax=Sulfitobacter sp. D35 TaxID=3083252 RepID=UPI00296F30FC|nr:hypothetical protein [Sulfitobacter sp. D35]MDW4498774.1 hypothetical protein [Sulfitobacter sp. D35]